jgi:hypothetical protein
VVPRASQAVVAGVGAALRATFPDGLATLALMPLVLGAASLARGIQAP